MRRLLILLALLAIPSLASAREGWRDWCWNGAKRVTTSGLNSTTTVQATTASCTVTIYVHGGSTLATIYSDNNNTPLANPFTGSNPNGQFIWYADNGRYDQTINVTINGASNTVTMSDVLLCDPYVTGSTCNNGGSTTAHNLLSTTHLDTIPESPPVRGDLITGQNQTSPTGVNPSWAALPLGTAGQVLLSNGLDALWGNLVAGTNITIVNSGSPSGSTVTINSTGGGSGCTLPGVTDTGILTEHPVSTCYDSSRATWDDTNFNLQIGSGSNVFTGTNTKNFILAGSNHLTDVTDANVNGASNTITCDANTLGSSTCDLFMIGGVANTVTNTGASSAAFSTHMYGRLNSLTVTGGSSSSTMMFFMRSNTATAGTGGDVDDSILMGLANDSQANGTGSITSSLFVIGENNSVHTVSGGDLEDNFILGENNSMSANAAASGGGFMTEIGFNHTIFTSTGGVQMNYGTAIGHANSNSDGSGATSTMTDFIMVGHSLHLVNCTDCFSMGKNIDQAGINNTLWLGMSASDVGLVITNSGGTHDNVRRTPMVFASLPACAAGTEGSFAAITDSSTNTWGATITGSSGSHVLGYCDGTNWTVAGK
jgi:hypothetical protein